MKNTKRMCLKTSVMLMVFILILSNFMPIISNVKALDIGENVNLVSLGECPHDLGIDEGYSVTTLVGYYKNGEFFPAYCLNKDLPGVTEELSYDVNIDHIMKNTETYNKIWRVVMAGYPYNTLEQMGVSSWQHAYQATKMAIYCVIGQRSPDEFFAYTPQGQEIVDCIYRLCNIANNGSSTYTSPICNMTADGTLYLEKINGKEYFIQKYNFSGNSEMPSFTVTTTEGIILNMQNQQQTNYGGNGSFKLAISKEKLNKNMQIKLKAEAKIKTYPILYGATSIQGMQDYCLSSYSLETTNATATLKVTIPSINIKKVDKNTNMALKGAEFNIYKDVNQNSKLDSGDTFITKTEKTNSDGITTLAGLIPGKYIAKEIKAPEGYLLDETAVQSFEIKTNGNNVNLQFSDVEPLGAIVINKTNNLGDNLAGAEFQIIANEDIKNISKNKIYYKKGQIVKTCKTDSVGKITVDNLPLGKYIVKEIKAPTGYLLNTNTYNVNLLYKDQNTAVVNYTINNVIDEEPLGIINIIKQDAQTGNVEQGDSKFEGAEYKIYASEDIYNVAKTKKIYSKNQVIATRIIKKDGTTEAVTNLPMGKYYIKETKAPEGYLIDNNTYNVSLLYKDQNTKIITSSVTSKENVKKRQVNIFKSGIKILSGLVPGLEGTEFTIKLNSDVEKALSQGYSYAEIWNGIDEYGNKILVDSNRINEAQKIAPTISKVITDKTGNAYTEMLPYGKYIVKETETPEDFESADDFTFSITKDETEIKDASKKMLRLVVNNEQIESYIKLVKKDKTTGKIVMATSTSFKIKATEDILDRATKKIIWHKGDYITQKIGKTTYDTFTTNSKNLVVSEKKKTFSSVFDDLGTVITPLKLPVGNYEIEEIETPEGFLKLDETVKFEIQKIRDYDKEEKDYIKEIEIYNEQPLGKIDVTKEIIYRGTENSDISLLDDLNLSDIEFKLTAKENILDKADNSIIHKAGEIIGKYNLTNEGKLQINNLPLGKYNLEEIKTIDGLVINKNPVEIELIKQDDTTRLYTKEISVENKTTLVEIYKIDIDSKKQIKGAKFALFDSEGKEITSWVSDGTPYIIEGLSTNKNYEIKELEAPKGYYLSDNNFKFNVANDEGHLKFEITNEIVLKNIIINKKDAESQKIIEKDFSFGLFEDKECTKLIKEVNSNGKGKIIFDNLKVGTYYVKETVAPDKYIISDRILKVEIKANKNEGIIIDEEKQKEERNTAEIDFENAIKKVLPKTGF